MVLKVKVIKFEKVFPTNHACGDFFNFVVTMQVLLL